MPVNTIGAILSRARKKLRDMASPSTTTMTAVEERFGSQADEAREADRQRPASAAPDGRHQADQARPVQAEGRSARAEDRSGDE